MTFSSHTLNLALSIPRQDQDVCVLSVCECSLSTRKDTLPTAESCMWSHIIIICSSCVLPHAETLPLCRGGGRYILRGDRLLSKGMALWDRIGLLFGCLTGSDLALLITCLGVLFSAVCLQCSTASPGHCFCRSLKFPFNWCLNFKLFSLQAGLERFTWIMGTTTSQQVRGKSPSVGSVRKTARN